MQLPLGQFLACGYTQETSRGETLFVLVERFMMEMLIKCYKRGFGPGARWPTN